MTPKINATINVDPFTNEVPVDFHKKQLGLY